MIKHHLVGWLVGKLIITNEFFGGLNIKYTDNHTLCQVKAYIDQLKIT
jgi:hypothetical protein